VPLTLQEKAAELKFQEEELFLVSLADGTDVLVSPLPYRVFLRFQELVQRGFLTSAEVENAVFQHCVRDSLFKDRYPHYISAGTVTAIAQQILAISGPQSAEETQGFVNHFMGVYNEDLYDNITRVIFMAFPTYTPDVLDQKSWAEILKLLARAQLLLLERGLLKAPIEIKQLESPKEEKKKQGIFGVNIPPVANQMPGGMQSIPEMPVAPQHKGKDIPPEVLAKRREMVARAIEAEKANTGRWNKKKGEVKIVDTPAQPKETPRQKMAKKRTGLQKLSGIPKDQIPPETSIPLEELAPEQVFPPEMLKFQTLDGKEIDISGANQEIAGTMGAWDRIEARGKQRKLRADYIKTAKVAHADLFRRTRRQKPLDNAQK